VVDRLTIGVGAMLAELVPGRVSTEVDADQAHDTAATIAKARQFIAMYEAAGVPRDKVLIKIAATWAGVEATRVLQAEGIDCNLTLIFNPTQALACSEAGAFLISPFVGRILDWYVANGQTPASIDEDPGVSVRARRVRRVQAPRLADGGDGRLVPLDRADRSAGRLRPPDHFAGPAGEAGRRPRRAAAQAGAGRRRSGGRRAPIDRRSSMRTWPPTRWPPKAGHRHRCFAKDLQALRQRCDELA
jgi:transaldolase